MKVSELVKSIITLLTITIISGCNSETTNIQAERSGYLVAPMENNIQYKCGDKKSQLENDGQFKCASFPVTFYVGSNSIGFIDSIHNDGYVFPQDIIQNQDDKSSFIKLALR